MASTRPGRFKAWKALACLLILVGVGGLDQFGYQPLYQAENYTQDFRLQLNSPAPKDSRLVCLAIDRDNYDAVFSSELRETQPIFQEMIQWPWKRYVHAALLKRLLDAEAAVVA